MQQGYREQLQKELDRRKLNNPMFSLRSFARTIGLSPSFLSNVLNGRKNLSAEAALKIAQKLRYSTHETGHFVDCVRQESQAPSLNGFSATASEGLTLQIETFHAISDWYHYAIRELTRTQKFKSDPKWIAKRLGITPEEAKEAVERLVKLGLIEKSSGGRLVSTKAFITTPTDQPSRAIRNHHQQMIQKAQHALEAQSVSKRDITGTTIAIKADQLELAKKEIQKFRKRLASLLETTEATDVYRLNVQFFSLTDFEILSPSEISRSNERGQS